MAADYEHLLLPSTTNSWTPTSLLEVTNSDVCSTENQTQIASNLPLFPFKIRQMNKKHNCCHSLVSVHQPHLSFVTDTSPPHLTNVKYIYISSKIRQYVTFAATAFICISRKKSNEKYKKYLKHTKKIL